MSFNLVTIVFFVTALQSLVAGIAFFLMKENKAPLHPKLLSMLFLLIAVAFIEGAVDNGGGYLHYPSFAFIANIFALGIPGMLYLYARSLTLETFHLRKRDIFHAGAILVVGTLALFNYHLQPYEFKVAFWQGGVKDSPLQSALLSNFILTFIVIQIVMLVRLMMRHHAALLQVRSNTFDPSYSFLKGIGFAYIGNILLNIIHEALLHTEHEELRPVVEVILGIWSYLMITALILAVTLWPERHLPLSEEEASITGFDTEADSADAEEASAETSPYWEELDARLETYLDEQKPYLDANLTLVQLARKLGVPGRELSAYINTRCGCNFSEFIASRRIEEAKQLITEGEQSITDAIYASGFNSKSVFNTHFKKQTGMTPSQWRETPISQNIP